MNTSEIIFGTATIGIGIIFTKMYIKSYRNGVKDTFGSEIRTLVGGIGLTVIGIVAIIKGITG